jgi:hypothetical protein
MQFVDALQKNDLRLAKEGNLTQAVVQSRVVEHI